MEEKGSKISQHCKTKIGRLKETMEILYKRFSAVGILIQEHLNDQSLVRIRKAYREIVNFLRNERFYCIGSLKNLKRNCILTLFTIHIFAKALLS